MITRRLKRIIDVLGSLMGIAALWPVMFLVALWVRLDTPGPVLFRQKRVGLDRSTFSILKFRTMVDRAGETDQSAAKVVSGGSDPRITRSGRFLRASSLDELPQLINILRGDMSLVGPRPLIPEQLEAVPAARMGRFTVRPGLTGLAQVRGRRGLDWLDQLALDAEYVSKCSLWLDIHIVIRTLFVVITASGVYGDAGSNWRAYLKTDDSPGTAAEVRGE